MYREYGLKAPSKELAVSAEQAASTAAAIGFPVVLKISSPDILHKTDVGGVCLDLRTKEQVRTCFSRVMTSVRTHAPQAHVDGVFVEEMCQGGVEVILGLHNDPQFGPTIMFGLGGVHAEILDDVSFRVLPISVEDARAMRGELRGRAILEGFRGGPVIPEALLVELIMRAARMGMDLAPRLDTIDLNPVMVWEDDHRVLDAKILLRPQAHALLHRSPDMSHLDRFFRAESVAVVGASATPGKIGHAVMESLACFGYGGRVYPVNPRSQELMGLTSYPSLDAIPDTVDLVVVVVGLSQVPDILLECPGKEAHAMVIISGGGKELGGDRAELEAKIARVAWENDVRIIGCNCIGVFDGQTRLDTPFQTHSRLERPAFGPVSILTQSGTVGAGLLEAFGDTGVSKMVSYGNRIDVDEADLLAFLAQDSSTEVVVCYIEGLEDAREFLATAGQVSRSKPIVAFKAGRTPSASKASISHTGFFSGTYRVWDGAFRQAGIVAAHSVEELHAAAKALAWQPKARGRRVGMISNGAGTMVQAIDLFPEAGMELACLSAESLASLRASYPPFYGVQNPLDLTGSAVTQDYTVGIETLLRDPNVDLLMAWFVFPNSAMTEDIVEALAELSVRYDKPMVCGALGGTYTQRMRKAMEAVGLPTYATVQEWVAAAVALGSGPTPAWQRNSRMGGT